MLDGKTIAITRSKDDASEFIELAKQNNATPIPLPTIELVSKGEKIVDEFLESIEKYNPDYSVFMSSKAVKLLFDTAKQVSKLEELRLAIANTIVMAVGPKTKIALEEQGIKVNEMPEKTYSSVGVGELFTKLHAVGKKVIVPISNQEVEIKTHHSVQKEFGSGAVMVCSYGDHNDVALFRELKLEEVIAIGLDGRMTEVAGEYVGLKPKQARTKIIEDLEKKGFVEKIEDIVHRTPISERSKNPIEIIPMEEYYLKQIDSLEKMKKLASEIKFYPEMHKQILMNWLDSISIDWPISRRRYYGTEIPIWYCKECSEGQRTDE